MNQDGENNSEAMIGGIFARAREEYDQIPRHRLTKQEVKAGWQAYRRYYREQQSWSDYREPWKFQSAFCELPNVHEVVVANATYNDRNFNSRPFWRRFCKDTYVGPDSWKRGYAAGVIEEELLFEITEKATVCLYEAMARRNEQQSSPVTKLKIQHMMQNESTLATDWRRGRRQPSCLRLDSVLQVPQRLWLAKPFAHLTDFSMRFDSNESVDRDYISEQIHQLLIKAQELRRLVLTLELPNVAGLRSFDEEDHEGYYDEFGEEHGDPHYSGEACLLHATSVIWPKIEHLALSVPFCAKKFINFLKLHSSTLRSLELHQALVYDVPTLLEQIPKVVHLDHVYIKTLVHIGPALPHAQHSGPFDKAWFLADSTDFDAPYEQSMKAYLLGKSSIMPDLLEDHLGRVHPQDRTDRTSSEPVNTIFYPSTFSELDYVKLESPTPEDVSRAGNSHPVD
ncbi:hypothetical protein CBER1_06153 [Cercospora berteroae]|uniref:Uncharacterized protein n=1 Tax=Cercospora berteroae TaxID=357750 RepID=A0A2S6C4H2_9PEZI|nr:hypothetical protein CBER1_06153 [Cercospora berteroae]